MAMPKNSIHFIAVNQADSPSESNNQEVKSHDSSLVEVRLFLLRLPDTMR